MGGFLNFLNLKHYFLIFKHLVKKSLYFFFSKKMLLIISLILFSVFTNFIFVFQPLKGKKWLSKIYKKPLQRTLEKMDVPLIENDMTIRILKIKHEGNIYLDFLSKQPDDSYLEINSVKLKGNRNAYFTYGKKRDANAKVTSLFPLDDDGDGQLDVIAPTFDKSFLPQINLVVYNKNLGIFELKSTFNLPQVVKPEFINYPSK